MINQIKNFFSPKKEEVEPTLTPKEQATKDGKPYVNIVQLEVDPKNVAQGAFELDWNQYFIMDLVKAGFVGKTDEQIIDQWFEMVCRNVALQTWEQYDADPANRLETTRKNLGNGRSEVS